MSRLALLVNPVAGGGRAARVGPRVAAALRGHGHRVQVLAGAGGTGDDGPPRRGPVPWTDALAGQDALVVVGGDGTVHAGLQATAGTDLPLGVVPAGTGNDVARSLGLPRSPDAAVAALLAALDRAPRRVDAVLAGTPDETPTRWYAGVLSCGFDAAVSARVTTMRWPRGRSRYLGGVAVELRGFVPYGYRLTLDDAVWASGGTLVAAANTPRFGGGIAIAPHASMTDGLLDVVLAGPVTRRGLVAVLPGAYRGRHLSHPAVTVLRTGSVLIEADTDRGAPPPVAFADGERLGPLPLRATVVPGALAVLA